MRITSDDVYSYGKGFDEYFAKIPDRYKEQWEKKFSMTNIPEEYLDFLKTPARPLKIIIIAETYCPDCAAAVSILSKMEKLSSFIDLQIIDKQLVPQAIDEYKVNGKSKIPIVVFADERTEEVHRYIEKSTYYWSLIHKSKVESFGKSNEEAKTIKKAIFSGQGQRLVDEVRDELWTALKRAYWLINAANPVIPENKQTIDPITQN